MEEDGENQLLHRTIHGTRGEVTIGTDTITKIFHNPENPSNQAQIRRIEKCLEYQENNDGQPPPGFPKVIRLVKDDAGKVVGYEQERIKGPNLRDYIRAYGKLSLEEAEELFLTLVELQKIFGQPHGDLGEEAVITCQNILVLREEGENGPRLKFYFIDYGGAADYEGRTPEEIKELIESERSMLLKALFFPRINSTSPYVVGDNNALLEVFNRLKEKITFSFQDKPTT